LVKVSGLGLMVSGFGIRIRVPDFEFRGWGVCGVQAREPHEPTERWVTTLNHEATAAINHEAAAAINHEPTAAMNHGPTAAMNHEPISSLRLNARCVSRVGGAPHPRGGRVVVDIWHQISRIPSGFRRNSPTEWLLWA
jgi:hypothetical protein